MPILLPSDAVTIAGFEWEYQEFCANKSDPGSNQHTEPERN
jgi:hypothetical protein